MSAWFHPIDGSPCESGPAVPGEAICLEHDRYVALSIRPIELSTWAELDALPIGSVVMTLWDDGPLHAVMQKYSDGWYGFPSQSALYPLLKEPQGEKVALLWAPEEVDS